MHKKNMVHLLVKFLDVKKLGYVKSLRKGPTGIGYTFETLIGKKEENFPIPDFETIEIKVKKQFGKGNITLFTAAPDNEVFATKRIYEQYGIENRNFRYNKTLMISVNTINLKKYGKHYFGIKVDYNKKLVQLQIYDYQMKLLEDDVSWSFDLLYEKINNKIQNLAIVKAKELTKDNEKYYFYYHISFYEIKSAECFIKLIEEGVITITFMISTYLTGKKYGEMNNHGIGFIINIQNILKLYYLKDFEKKTTNSRF